MKKIFFLLFLSFHANVFCQDSTDLPIKRKIGIGHFPSKERVSLTYAFGKNGQFLIQNNFGIDFSASEIRFLYAWKSCSHKKLYSGIGGLYENYKLPSEKISTEIVPFGIEWHPIKRLRKLGIIAEADLYFSNKIVFEGRYGLNYYF